MRYNQTPLIEAVGRNFPHPILRCDAVCPDHRMLPVTPTRGVAFGMDVDDPDAFVVYLCNHGVDDSSDYDVRTVVDGRLIPVDIMFPGVGAWPECPQSVERVLLAIKILATAVAIN